MGGLIVTWRRANYRNYSFEGAVYDGEDLVWTCGHRHSLKNDAEHCAAMSVREWNERKGWHWQWK